MSNYTKYLEAAITRWYTNTKMGYNVNGRWVEEDEENVEDVA